MPSFEIDLRAVACWEQSHCFGVGLAESPEGQPRGGCQHAVTGEGRELPALWQVFTGWWNGAGEVLEMELHGVGAGPDHLLLLLLYLFLFLCFLSHQCAAHARLAIQKLSFVMTELS
jgi:hypothetical protein